MMNTIKKGEGLRGRWCEKKRHGKEGKRENMLQKERHGIEPTQRKLRRCSFSEVVDVETFGFENLASVSLGGVGRVAPAQDGLRRKT